MSPLMPKKPKPAPADPKQSKRFAETAKAIGAAASAEEFERAFKTVVPRASATRRDPKDD